METFTKIPNYLFLYFDCLDSYEIKILLYIIRYTLGFHRTDWETNITELSNKNNIGRMKIYGILKQLKEKEFISYKRVGKDLIISFDESKVRDIYFI